MVPHPRLLSGPQVLDRTYLDRLRQLDDQDGFVAEVIQDFIADAEQLVLELEAAALGVDAAAFRVDVPSDAKPLTLEELRDSGPLRAQ